MYDWMRYGYFNPYIFILLDDERTYLSFYLQTPIQLCSGIIAKDERYFENPNDFVPERWLKGAQKANINPFAHLPFGHGPRKCVGQRFAEQEIYICVAKVKRHNLSNYQQVDGVSGIFQRGFIVTTFSLHGFGRFVFHFLVCSIVKNIIL